MIAAPGPIASATASAATSVSSGQRATGGGGPQDDREREPGARLVDPDAAEPAAALGLVLGDRDGAVRRVSGGEHALRRRRLGRVVVRPAEAAAQRGRTRSGARVSGGGSASRTRVGAPVQPRPPSPVQVPSSSPRSDAPLVYERLSDPILVTRAKDGDATALAALCERHAPRVEKLALHLLRDPEDARDAAQDSLAKLVVRVRQFRGESQFSTWLHRLVVNTCKDFAQAKRARRTEPLRRGRARRPRRRPGRGGRRRGDAPRARPLPRRAAAGQATVVALKDAFDLGFAEISAATGLPVGTAKCYAHRGRERLRERLSA